MLNRVFHAVGYALDEIEFRIGTRPAAAIPDAAGGAPGAGSPGSGPTRNDGPEAARPRAEPTAREPGDPIALLEGLGAAAGVIAGGWLLAWAFKPRRVSWPRVILAGLAATALYDLAHLLERRVAGDEAAATPPDEASEAPAETFLRYAAGLGTAVAYASVFYPRLPGPPLARGLTFGALEAAAAPSGGLIGVLRSVSPQWSFPLQQLAAPLSAHGSPLAHLAYGLGLGLLYRPGGSA